MSWYEALGTNGATLVALPHQPQTAVIAAPSDDRAAELQRQHDIRRALILTAGAAAEGALFGLAFEWMWRALTKGTSWEGAGQESYASGAGWGAAFCAVYIHFASERAQQLALAPFGCLALLSGSGDMRY